MSAFISVLFLAMIFHLNNAQDCPILCDCHDIAVYCENKTMAELPTRIPRTSIHMLAGRNYVKKIPVNEKWKNLQTLTLQHNKVQTLLPHNFANLHKLKYLDLSNNKIPYVPHETFANLSSLQFLNLNDNNISRISSNAFGDLHELSELYLSRNQLSAVTPELFASLTNLKSLSLTGNNIQVLPDGIFKSLRVLTQLLLNENKLTKITSNTMQGLHNLEMLNLGNNSLTYFDQYEESEQLNCQQEKLTENNGLSFNDVENGCLSTLYKLDTLDLSGNKLKFINYKSFEGLGNFKTIHLSRNMWRCTCYLKVSIQRLREITKISRLGYKEVNCHTPAELQAFDLDDFTLNDFENLVFETSTLKQRTSFPSNPTSLFNTEQTKATTRMLPLTNATSTSSVVFSTKSSKVTTILLGSTKSDLKPTKSPKIHSVIHKSNTAKHWMAAIIALLSVFVIIVLAALVIHHQYGKQEKAIRCCFKRKKDRRTQSYIRSVTNYPMLYENPLAQRPLPSQPEVEVESTNSVKWTNGGMFQLGSSSQGLLRTAMQNSQIEQANIFREKVPTKLTLQRHQSMVASYMDRNEARNQSIRSSNFQLRKKSSLPQTRKKRPESVMVSLPSNFSLSTKQYSSQMNIRKEANEDKPVKLSKKFSFETTPTHKNNKKLVVKKEIDPEFMNRNYSYAKDADEILADKKNYHILSYCSSGVPEPNKTGTKKAKYFKPLKTSKKSISGSCSNIRNDSTDSLFVSLNSARQSLNSLEYYSDYEGISSNNTFGRRIKKNAQYNSALRKEKLKLFGSDKNILDDLHQREKKMQNDLQFSYLDKYKLELSASSSEDEDVFTNNPKEESSAYNFIWKADNKVKQVEQTNNNNGFYNSWMPLSFYEDQHMAYGEDLKPNKQLKIMQPKHLVPQSAYTKNRRPSSCIFTNEPQFAIYKPSFPTKYNGSLQNITKPDNLSKQHKENCYFTTVGDSSSSDGVNTDVEEFDMETF